MSTPARLVRFPAGPLVVLALAGCASVSGLDGSSRYACKAPEGVTCESISGTYANAIQNKLPSQRQHVALASIAQATPPANTPAAGTAAHASSLALAQPSTTSTTPSAMGLPPTPMALRSTPRILRLWFKPWEDADHDLYDQGYVYVQVDRGRWQIEHVQRQIRDAHAPVKPPARSTRKVSEDETAPPSSASKPNRSGADTSFPSRQTPAMPVPRGSGDTE